MEKSSKAADLVLERCQLLKSVHALEANESESESAARIAELENQTTTAAARIAGLETQNAELGKQVKERLVDYQPDPEHAKTANERDMLRIALEGILSFIASLPEETRAEVAVRMYQSHPAIAETVCRSVKIDYGAVINYTTYSEANLKRLQTARDSNGIIIRAVLAVNYPAPAKPEAPEAFVPDNRPVEEKEREAKEYARLAWRR